jgi:RDD family
MHVPRIRDVEGRDATERPLVTLLRGYRDLLEHRPAAIVWMPRGHGLGRLVRVPCIRWIARYFTSAHIRRSLIALERRYTARIALDEACAVERAELERIKAFRSSLAPVLLAGVAITSVFTGFASLGLTGLGSVLGSTGAVDGLQGMYESEIGKSNTWAEELLLAAFVLPLAISVLLAPVVGAFRLKRALFNLHPGLDATTPRASDHAGRATGVYGLERDAYTRLGAPAPREFPLDLAASTLPTVAVASLMAAFAIIAVQFALEDDPLGTFVGLFWAVAFAPLVVIRLRRTFACARARAAGGEAPVHVSAQPARMRTRWRAQIVDLPAVAAISIGLWVAVGTLLEGPTQEVLAWATPTIAGLAYAVLSLARGNALFGQPLGRSQARLAVVRADGEQAEWWRHLLRDGVLKWGLFGAPSVFMFGVPMLANLLWPYVDTHNRALHDVIAGTVVTAAAPTAELSPAVVTA